MKLFKFAVSLMALTIVLTACSAGGEKVVEDTGNGEQAATEAAEETTQETGEAQVQEEAVQETEEEFILGFDLGNSIYPYCVLVGETVESYGKEKGITVIMSDCGGDVNVQNDNMENFVIQGANAISGIYQDKDGSVTSIYLAQENNIPIISCCQFIVGADDIYDPYIFCGSENFDGGVSAMEDWLNMYDISEITCVAGVADDPVLGALEAAKAAGVADQIMFVGLDASEAALESIEAGEMAMSVFQNAVAQAKAVIDVCVDIRSGKDPAQMEDVFVPYEIVTAENVADYWQYYQ